MKTKTKSIMTICLAAALVAVAVMGTIAYMTATSYKENTFTVGDFGYPTVDPTKPEQSIDIDGYIYEPAWVDGSKLIPGKSVAKDPYVGIGKDSDPAWVYVYIDNQTLESAGDKLVTFKLNDGWVPVAEKTVDAGADTDDGKTKYVSGLFKYSTILNPASADAWTAAPIFNKVDVDATVTKDKFKKVEEKFAPKMTVYAYIHQANDDSGAIDTDTIEQAAKAWAEGLNE